jgi:2-polyprenyl-3-methyl-5-hydroxy-6-metoxy-1,4-benzoquinol methylase
MRPAARFEHALEPREYWERRAQRFATRDAGLAAVCSYGMPVFYNRFIDRTQRLALRRWLRVAPGSAVLDVGCGVGRWSRLLAARGARVTGVDISPTMTREAANRAATEGVGERCRFLVGDLAGFATGEQYDLMLGVTVLQHILDDANLERALANLRAHLRPGGRMVLLEAAPTRRERRCDSPIFKARSLDAYLAAFAAVGLRAHTITGVDPAPLKTLFLPYYARLPRPLALAGLAVATALSYPLDALLGRRLARASWHKVFVLGHGDDAPA